MLLLLLVVLLNTYVSVAFRIFKRMGIDSFVAIVINYWICVVTGSVTLRQFPVSAATLTQPWARWAMLLGLGFIGVSNLMAWCVRRYGITSMTIANKLSLVIPVTYALLFLPGETAHWTKILGVLVALPAVALVTSPSGNEPDKKPFAIGWGITLLFLGSGGLDTLVTLLSRNYLDARPELQPIATIHIFFSAALLGTVLLIYRLIQGQSRLTGKNVLGGMLLGVPNYFPIYLLVRLLATGPFQPSVAVPVTNIAIVVSSVLAAILLFREPADGRRWLGIGLSVIAIFLIAFKAFFPEI
jgi:drug/metabolite transporter (DMT)-like permease